MDSVVNETINYIIKTNGTNVMDKIIYFSWYDYALFAIMLALSTAIGIYFGCFGNKQSSADDYLLGGKEMEIFPISMSLVASYVSGLTLLAVPADIYLYGFSYSLSLLSIIVVCICSYYIYLPVFHKLQITSVYEYLSLRFDDKIRMIASGLFVTGIAFYLPIVIYIPALAFSQATGFNVHYITPVICAVCIFYTTIGGLKAVVWTDTLQIISMIAGIIVVLYIGIVKTGGLYNIFKISFDYGRFDLEFDWSPYKRDTFWSAAIGLTFNWIGLGIGQGFVQKFMALPRMRDIKWALVIFCIGLMAINFTSLLIGLIMFATYAHCDPITVGIVKKPDQLLPHFVLDVAGDFSGLPGLFIAGIVCAALSTLSAVMNSLSGTIYQDFVARFMPKDITQKAVSNILKMIVLIIGIACTGMVYVVEHMGGLLPLAISFGGITAGPKLGLFTLGMLVPFANAKGAFYGCMSSLCIMIWIIIGSQWYQYNGMIKSPAKPLYTDGCDDFNLTYIHNFTSSNIEYDSDEPFFLYRITNYYYTLIGFLLVLIIAIPVSYFTRDIKEELNLNPDTITPLFKRFIITENDENIKLKMRNIKETNKDYLTIDQALDMFNINNENYCDNNDKDKCEVVKDVV